MKLIDSIEDNTLLIVPISIKKEIIKEITCRDKILNIKYISFEEIEHLVFNYDNRAIYYLMNKYGFKYEVALVYLNSMRYLEKDYYSSDKLKTLVKLKKELIEKKLIEENSLDFNLYKKVIIYGYTYLTEYRHKIIDDLFKEKHVLVIEDNNKNYIHQIYEFNNIKDEVAYVATKICELITNKIDIKNIKLIVEDKSYYEQINAIFSLFNINTSIVAETPLNVTKMGKYFLSKLDNTIDDIIKMIREKFNLNEGNNLLVYNEIIKIINSYKDNSIINDMIKYDFRNCKIKDQQYVEQIKVVTLFDSYIKDEDYVFLLGFNQKIVPKIYKDEEFLSNNELKELHLETSYDKNGAVEKYSIKRISEIKNLIITYKLQDNNDNYLISNLNEKLNYDVIKFDTLDYLYSNKYNEIKLAILLDKLMKYNVYEESLELLYSNYREIKYLDYNNSYEKIEKKELLKYLNNNLLLSYTSLNNYYECGFKYYISNILKLVPYTKTYMTIIGEVFHYVLSKAFLPNFDFEKEYDNFINNVDYKYTYKERFFLNKLKAELIFIINTIKKQYEYCDFDNSLYEEKIIIENKVEDVKVIFMGVIDKLMYKKDENKTLVSIIDYKTGNVEVKLNNIIYGLDMQLPIYLYLAKNLDSLDNIEVVGFYLQKLLHSSFNKNEKKSVVSQKEDSIKLHGYTVNDVSLLEKFDNNYSSSKVINGMSINKDDSFSKTAKVLSPCDIEKIASIAKNNINKAIINIINTSFDINPKVVGKENKACKYCQFYDICFFQNKDLVEFEEIDLSDILKEEY